MVQPTRTEASQDASEVAAGPFAFQIAPPAAVRLRRALVLLLLGLVTYMLALLASLPARLILGDPSESAVLRAVGGTVWSGEAALDEGHGVRWTWAPGASLVNFAFTVDWEITGPDTSLKGQTSWRPSGMNFVDVEGQASGALLAALTPRLPFRCDFLMRVRIDALQLRGQQKGADGRIESSRCACALRDAPAIAAAMPPLVGTATLNVGGSTGVVAPQGEPVARLITATVTPNGMLSVRLLPAGLALLPPGAALGPVSWDQQL